MLNGHNIGKCLQFQYFGKAPVPFLIGCFSCQREGLTHVDWGGGPASLLHLLLSPLLSFFCPPTSPLSLVAKTSDGLHSNVKCLTTKNQTHYIACKDSGKWKLTIKIKIELNYPFPHRPYFSEIS